MREKFLTPASVCIGLHRVGCIGMFASSLHRSASVCIGLYRHLATIRPDADSMQTDADSMHSIENDTIGIENDPFPDPRR